MEANNAVRIAHLAIQCGDLLCLCGRIDMWRRSLPAELFEQLRHMQFRIQKLTLDVPQRAVRRHGKSLARTALPRNTSSSRDGGRFS